MLHILPHCVHINLVIISNMPMQLDHVMQIYLSIYDYVTMHYSNTIGQLPRLSGEDPERNRVDSVFETSVLYWPTPSSIQRGSREDRVDSVFETLVLCLFVSLSANFLISFFQPSLFIQYSTEECSTVQVFIWCLDTIA